MDIESLIAWYRYILSYNFYKYLGIAIMAIGPLFLIYLYVFEDLLFWQTVIGSLVFLLMGSFVWNYGWDTGYA